MLQRNERKKIHHKTEENKMKKKKKNMYIYFHHISIVSSHALRTSHFTLQQQFRDDNKHTKRTKLSINKLNGMN